MHLGEVGDVERASDVAVHLQDDGQDHAGAGLQRLVQQCRGGVARAGGPAQVIERHVCRDVIDDTHAVGRFGALVEDLHIKENAFAGINGLSLRGGQRLAQGKVPNARWQDGDVALVVVVFVAVVVIQLVVGHETVIVGHVVSGAVHVGDLRALGILGTRDFGEVVQRAAFRAQGDGVGDADAVGLAGLHGIDDQAGGCAVGLRYPVRAERGVEHQAGRRVVHQGDVVHGDVALIEDFNGEGDLAACLDRIGLRGGQRLAQGEVILRIVEAEVEAEVRVGVHVAVVHRFAVASEGDGQALHIIFAQHFKAVTVLAVVIVRISSTDRGLQTRCGCDPHNVVARSKVDEQILAINARGLRRHQRADIIAGRLHVGEEEFYLRALHADLTEVLNAIVMCIQPDKAAEAERHIDVSRVHNHDVLTSSQHDVGSAARGGIRIAVLGVVAALIEQAELSAIRQVRGEADGVGAGLEIGEGVVAETVRDIAANGRAGAVIQGHADI